MDVFDFADMCNVLHIDNFVPFSSPMAYYYIVAYNLVEITVACFTKS